MIRLSRPADRDDDDGDRPRFAPGDLVRHRRYGYRGVVVEADPECRASESWYRSNQSQPDRGQAWYHVIVHAAAHTTYAAEENLEVDTSDEPIEHPWVELFFASFVEGRYVRNEVPWPTSAP